MEVIKKNIFSIIFGVIALLAVVAVYWPIGGMYDELLGKLNSRLQVNSQLETLANQSRLMPVLSPDHPNASPLGLFPTQQVIDKGQAANQLVAQQATNMSDMATNANRHDLLLPPGEPELPMPNSQARYDFAIKYSQEVAGYSRWQKILDSTSPPTPKEVDAEKAKLLADINKRMLSNDLAGNPTPDSQAEAQAEFALESPQIQPRMEMERALHHRVYLLVPPNANPFPVDLNIKVSSYPTPDVICVAQIVVWVLDDVANAIKSANDHYSDPATPGGPPQYDVLHSAVKQIELIEPPSPVVSSGTVDQNSGISSLTPKLTAFSPTGRVCNGLYDVLRFKLRLVVDAAKIPQIVRELESGRFITVLNVQVTGVVDPVIAAANQQGGFRFGNKPVVHVEIDCEELFMKSWTDSILPASKKNGLGKADLGAPTDTGEEPYPGSQYNPSPESPPYNGGSNNPGGVYHAPRETPPSNMR